MRRLTTVEWVALASACTAFAAWALWYWAADLPASGFIGAWMPNLGTDAALLAFTLIPLDAALRRRDRQRRRSVIVPTLRQLGRALQDFAEQAALDYAQTHTDNYVRPPDDLSEALAHWHAGLETADTPRIPGATPLPMVIRSATAFRDVVDRLDERYAQELDDVDLTAAMRRFVGMVTAAESVGALATSTYWDEELELRTVSLVASPAQRLAAAWDRTARAFGITDQQSIAELIQAADGLHRAILRQREGQTDDLNSEG